MKNYFKMDGSKEEILQAMSEISDDIRSPKTTQFSVKVSSLSKAQKDFYNDVVDYYRYEAIQLAKADNYQNDQIHYEEIIISKLGINYEIEKTWAGKKVRLTDYNLYL